MIFPVFYRVVRRRIQRTSARVLSQPLKAVEKKRRVDFLAKITAAAVSFSYFNVC
jgi:hypothetical protein